MFTVSSPAIFIRDMAAWGRYWGWDTKEVWTFIIWVVYAGYIHARATRGWRGSRSAWLAIIGFSTVLFTMPVLLLYRTARGHGRLKVWVRNSVGRDVGATGFEPAASRSQSGRSTKLSYAPGGFARTRAPFGPEKSSRRARNVPARGYICSTHAARHCGAGNGFVQ